MWFDGITAVAPIYAMIVRRTADCRAPHRSVPLAHRTLLDARPRSNKNRYLPFRNSSGRRGSRWMPCCRSCDVKPPALRIFRLFRFPDVASTQYFRDNVRVGLSRLQPWLPGRDCGCRSFDHSLSRTVAAGAAPVHPRSLGGLQVEKIATEPGWCWMWTVVFPATGREVFAYFPGLAGSSNVHKRKRSLRWLLANGLLRIQSSKIRCIVTHSRQPARPLDEHVVHPARDRPSRS